MKKILSLPLLILILIFLFLGNCSRSDLGRETMLPVLSTLFNNRMLLLLKGTYATDKPLEFSELNSGTGQLYIDTTDSSDSPNDPPHNLAGLPLAQNLPIYIDIGEVRISSKYQQGLNNLSQIRNPIDSQKFWDFIAPNRQVYCTQPYELGGNTCRDNEGEFRAAEFFNGTGAAFPSKDPTAETTTDNLASGTRGTMYYYTGIYFRSFVTAWGTEGGGQLINTARFDNRRVQGVNIIPRLNYDPGTATAVKAQLLPQMFPLLHQVQGGQDDMQIRSGFDPYILEVRMNFKENMMVHSWNTPRNNVQTMVGVSDWLVPHQGEGDMGGNILVRSRIIYPETASRLKITGGRLTYKHYYAVFRAAETDTRKQLPLAATPARDGISEIRYLQAGDYKLFCMGDIDKVDGFPETTVSQTTFSVPEVPFRGEVNVDLSCP